MVNDGFKTAYQPLDAPRRTERLRATFLQRAGAFAVDGVLGFVCVPVVVSAFFVLTDRHLETCVLTGESVMVDGQTVLVEACTANVGNQWLSRIMFWTLLTLFVLALSWLTSRRRTVSQKTTGMAIVDHESGERISVGRAVLRHLAMVVSAAPLGLGFWWALWGAEGRTWHDSITGTSAIRY